MLSTARLASNATIDVIVLFLSLGKAASPDVYTTFDGGLLSCEWLFLLTKESVRAGCALSGVGN